MNYLQDIYFTNLNMVYNMGGFFSIDGETDWSWTGGTFEQCKFYFITEGECVVEIGNKTYHAKAGDWLLIPANLWQSYYNVKGKPFKKYWMHFDIYPDTGLVDFLSLPFMVSVGKSNKAEKIFDTLVKAAMSNELSDKLTVKSCLFSLLMEYVKLAKPEGVSVQSRADARLDDVLRYINENLDKPLPNELLAEKYFAHPNHFIRAFKDKTGQTPAKYIKARRMETAKRLLESTDLTIAEITEKLGINDSAHFSRLFKEQYNMPPAKYREYFKSQLIV